MGVFVDENDTFSIKIYYKENRDENNKLLNVETSDKYNDGWNELEAYFCQPSVATFSAILEEATVLNSLNQKPVIRTRTLRDLVLLHFMKDWSLKDSGDNKIPINQDTVGKLVFGIANELFLQYIYNVKIDVYLQAIIKDEKNNENLLRGL